MKRILVLYDDIWHPADVIEKGFAALLEKVNAGVAGGEVSRAGFLISRGKGWVIVTTPGHTLSMLTNPDYQQFLENVIRYYL
ncbi:MAG: hypothetical protein IKG91_07065 [Firmicutes bacterium]|nr:hypothetical protein [Bacillota bacterium]